MATSQNNLAHVYSQNGKLTEAEALAREALATRRRLFGNESLEVADSLRNLAVILGDKRQWAEAEAMGREVLEMKQQEAEDLERKSLAMRQKLLSQEHPDVANSLYLVGDRMRQRGKLKESYPVLNAALSLQRKVLGEDHPATLYTLKSLGLMYEVEKEWSQAETVFRQVLAAWRKRAGNDDPETLYAQRDLADVLEGQGKWAEAETLHGEALVSWRKREGNGGSETSYTLHKLGVALGAQEKWSQAESVYREEWALRRKQAGNDDPETLYALRNIGITLEFEGKWAEAETVHQEALASWRKRAGNDDPQTLYTLDRVGWTLQAQSRWLEAETAYREALTSRRKQATNDSPELLSECEQLCVVLGAQRKYHDMEQLLDEVLTPELLKQPSCCPLVARRLDVMGRQGKWREAADAAATLNKYQPDEYYWLYNMSALSAATHDRPAYEQVCKRIPASFSETTNSYVAWRLAEGCLLLPNSGADRRLVEQLATKAATLGSGDVGIGYFQACKALSEYREGGFAQAVEWAEQGRTNSEAFARAEASAVLAMAQWRLGLQDAARATLNQGNKLASEISSTGAVDLGDGWLDWLIARILLDEATDLVGTR